MGPIFIQVGKGINLISPLVNFLCELGQIMASCGLD